MSKMLMSHNINLEKNYDYSSTKNKPSLRKSETKLENDIVRLVQRFPPQWLIMLAATKTCLSLYRAQLHKTFKHSIIW